MPLYSAERSSWQADFAPAQTAPMADQVSDVTNVTDPSIIKEDDTYYLFSSGTVISVRESTDLIQWGSADRVFSALPDWAVAKVPGATQMWAPDISFFNGEYHLYYAVSTFGSKRSVIGLATNSTLDPTSSNYAWVDQGEVIESTPRRTTWNAIDPNIAFDHSGNPWLAFGSQWSGIKLTRIDPLTGKPLPSGPDPKLISLVSRPGLPLEASFVYQRNLYYYTFVSFNNCCEGAASTYQIRVGRSRSITGPYHDRSGKPMMKGGGTLVLGSEGRYRGPGSNAVLQDGDHVWLVYHVHDALNHGIPVLQIRPLTWDRHAWPVAGKPIFY